jgi:hypothetical protein
MPRVREIEEDGGDPTLAEVFKKERDIFGGLLNTTKVLAHCRYRAIGAASQGADVVGLSPGRLDQRLSILN